ncbi:MAG: hypothetical protein CL927_15565 [Deltaproteobacteria bacterium]|nr:hypothetical protein [Deltaproteobacteria bacterium]HCH65598.1 hypothetical protein [Deltaproteobacteria bacterium]
MRREQEAARRATLGDSAGARAAWRSAAESWRQCDRPVRAARALAQALSDAPPDALGSALLAGVLQDVGQVVAAREAAEDAVRAAVEPGARVLALDVLTGILLMLGEVGAARIHLETLRRSPGPAAALAASFRLARFQRLEGDLEGAIAGLESVVHGLPAADRRFAAPRAAALHDIAEFHLLAGRVDAAQSALGIAGRAWARARRRPGAFVAEGLSVRLGLARGLPVLPDVLDNALDFAEQRGLVLLGAELRIARARAAAAVGREGASSDFDRAVEAAKRAQTPLLEGRARLWRRVSGCLGDANDVVRTRELLGADRILGLHPALGARK